jgi:hypothetical protein
VCFVPNASDNRYVQLGHERDAIWSRPGIQSGPGLQCVRINPSQVGTAAVRDQDATFACDDACSFWKAVERGNVPVGVSVNHLKTVAGHVRDENAAALGFESSVVKRCTR